MIWKNGAKAAFALGLDLDGRTIWRNKAHKLPGGQDFIKGVSIGDFGVKVGTPRLLDILDEYGLNATWFIPAEIVEEHPKTVQIILARGHEIAHHGYDHRGNYGNTTEEQIAYIEKCQDVFLKYTGVKAKGFRGTGSILPDTARWLYTDGGFVYESCGVSGEACTWVEVEGEKTKAVNIPCRDEMMDDYMQTVMNSYPQVLVGMPRIAPYRNPYENWMNEVKGIIRYGTAGSPAFHPQIAGTPGRAIMFERFCRYLVENSSLWCSTCIDLAEYFIEHNGGGDHE